MSVTIGIEGMSCGGCVASVQKALGDVAGVKKVAVSLEKREAVVDGDALDPDSLRRAVEDAGYDVRE